MLAKLNVNMLKLNQACFYLLLYTGSFNRTVIFHFFSSLARKLQIILKRMATFLYVYDILILKFENNQKTFFVKIDECGKNFRFLNISENTKENLINFPD